jgi:DNA-binding CsgD family transcriptional regulator
MPKKKKKPNRRIHIRVCDVAKQMTTENNTKVTSKDVLLIMKDIGLEERHHNKEVSEEEIYKIKTAFEAKIYSTGNGGRRKLGGTTNNKTTLTERELTAIGRLAGMGLAQKEIAYALGYHEVSFAKKKAKDSLLKEALSKGGAKIKAQVFNKAFALAIDGNVQMLKFLLERVYGMYTKKEGDVEDINERAENIRKTINMLRHQQEGKK